MVTTRRRSTVESNDAEPKPPAKKLKREIHSQVAYPSNTPELRVRESLEVAEENPPQRPKRKGKAKVAQTIDPSTFLKRVNSPWLVGAHVSAAKGVENAVTNAAAIGATSFALFVKSQRKWTSPDLTKESIAEFKKRMKEYGYTSRMVLPHGSHLINLGNPDAEKRAKSYTCFVDDLKRCEALGLELYNFHPGSTVGQATTEESCALIAECINRAHKETQSITAVLENMAGAGNIIGSNFAHLAEIIAKVEDKSRVGVCIDTCHAFAAGYDIKTKEGWESTIKAFEDTIGIKYLCGMHLNDSKTDHNSKRDRHENIGLGYLGLNAFHHILSDPRTRGMPLILETPSFEQPKEVWGKEIEVLRRISGNVAGPSDNPSAEEVHAENKALHFSDLADQIKSAVKEAEKQSGGSKTRKASTGRVPTRKRKQKVNSREEDQGDPDDDDIEL